MISQGEKIIKEDKESHIEVHHSQKGTNSLEQQNKSHVTIKGTIVRNTGMSLLKSKR